MNELLFSSLAAAMMISQQVPATPGNAQIGQWEKMLDSGKLDDAAEMVKGRAHYRDSKANVEYSLPAREFIEWMLTCKPTSFFNVAMSVPSGAPEVRAFAVTCPTRGTSGVSAPTETLEIEFGVKSSGDGVTI